MRSLPLPFLSAISAFDLLIEIRAKLGLPACHALVVQVLAHPLTAALADLANEVPGFAAVAVLFAGVRQAAALSRPVNMPPASTHTSWRSTIPINERETP